VSEAAKAVPRQRRMEVVRPEEYPTVYTNSAQVSMSPYDLRIDFGDAISSEDNVVKVHQRVQVVMSPQHAFALSDALKTAIEAYKKDPTVAGDQE
jgi:hypothetical protein